MPTKESKTTAIIKDLGKEVDIEEFTDWYAMFYLTLLRKLTSDRGKEGFSKQEAMVLIEKIDITYE